MIKNKYYLQCLIACLGVLAACVLSVGSAPAARADTVGCSPEAAAVHAGTLPSVPADTYDVFARLAKRGQEATASVGVKDGHDSDCTLIGTSELTGDSWTKVGTWTATKNINALVIELASDDISPDIRANRSAIMLVSATNPACAVVEGACITQIDDNCAAVLPPGNAVAFESLRAVRPIPPGDDSLLNVTYYVDNVPAYSSQALEPFDTRYALDESQEVLAVAEYASGQRITFEEQLPDGYSATIGNMLFQIFQTNSRLYITLMITASVIALAALIMLIIRAMERRHAWLEDHGFLHHDHHPQFSPGVRVLLTYLEFIKRWIKRALVFLLIVISLFAIVAGIFRYIGTISWVSGYSMENTYTEGDRILVNKLPITWSKTAGRKYLPERGAIVIAKPVYNIIDPLSDYAEESSLMVKRVLGLPGERITIHDGEVTIYTTDGEIIYPDTDTPWSASIIDANDNESIDLTLGSDEIFVAGDNRSASLDSRYNGPITLDQVAGVATLKLP